MPHRSGSRRQSKGKQLKLLLIIASLITLNAIVLVLVSSLGPKKRLQIAIRKTLKSLVKRCLWLDSSMGEWLIICHSCLPVVNYRSDCIDRRLSVKSKPKCVGKRFYGWLLRFFRGICLGNLIKFIFLNNRKWNWVKTNYL